jgi:phytoene dehydrogenase-like protein
MSSTRILVVGGGANGLAAAFRLAGAGRKVTVLEAAEISGGGAGDHEIAAGYRAPALAHLLTALDPRVEAGMDLARHGLRLTSPLATTALSATGDHLRVTGGTTTGPDTAAWAALHARLLTYATALAPFRAMTPPRLARADNELIRLAKLALGLRRMGREEFRDFLRLILINVADVLEDELTDDRLRGLVAFDATLGTWLGPRSPNSLILYLNRLSVGGGEARLPLGGMGGLARAMTRACEAAGVTVRTGARVTRIRVERDRAAGAVLDTGEEMDADLVISTASTLTTFRDMVGPRHLDAGFLRDVGNIRSRGAAAKLTLALSGAPDFRGADLRTRLVIAPSVDAVETAFNPVKYGEVPAHPVMEIVLPSAHEADHAPEGHHVLSAIVQYAPHAPKDRDAARAEMLANTLSVLEAHAPGIGKLILKADLLMPRDIEERFGLQGGNWHSGELSVERMLFLRPLQAAAQYATPLPGLWIGGAGSHPGGGISGAAGWNAVERILKVGA